MVQAQLQSLLVVASEGWGGRIRDIEWPWNTSYSLSVSISPLLLTDVIAAAWPEFAMSIFQRRAFTVVKNCFSTVSKDVNNWSIISFLVAGRCVSKRYSGPNNKPIIMLVV
jgi:hypothetical protein